MLSRLILLLLISLKVSASFDLFFNNIFEPNANNAILKFLMRLPINDCTNQLRHVAESLNKSWALKMVDAIAKPQAGILLGNIMHVGNYDECLEVKDEDVQGKYCTVPFNPHPQFASKELKEWFSTFAAETSRPDEQHQLVVQGKFSVGLCVPKACTVRDLQTLVEYIEDEFNSTIHFQFVDDFCHSSDGKPLTTSAVVAIVIFSIFGVIVIGSTLYDIFVYQYDKDKKPNICIAFSALTNGRKLLSTKTSEGNLNCLNGLRVISMMWVVLSHNFQYSFFVPLVNVAQIDLWRNETSNTFITAGSMSVDTFFTVSGLLLVYLFMKSQAKSVKFSLGMFYFHRILRLTPSLAMTVLFTATLITYMGQGPFWPIVYEMFQKNCENNWWVTLIYLQNYIYPHDQCVGQAWYLAVDTQMYFISPLILFPLVRWPKKTIAAILVFVVLNCSYVFEITWKKRLGTTLFDQDDTQFEYLYHPTHVRGTVYLIGMICGYVVFKTRTTHPLKLSKRIVWILWGISLLGMLAIVLLHYPMTHTNKETDLFEISFFNSLTRVGWSFALCILILLCVNGYGGLIDSFLSSKIFTVLIRLNYNIYLLHMAVMIIITAQRRTPSYFSNLFCLYNFWGDYMFTLGAAVLWTLMFESPILTIEKIIFAPRKSSTLARDGCGVVTQEVINIESDTGKNAKF